MSDTRRVQIEALGESALHAKFIEAAEHRGMLTGACTEVVLDLAETGKTLAQAREMVLAVVPCQCTTCMRAGA